MPNNLIEPIYLDRNAIGLLKAMREYYAEMYREPDLTISQAVRLLVKELN